MAYTGRMKWMCIALLLGGCKKTVVTPVVDLTAVHGTLLDQPKSMVPAFAATAQDGAPRDVADLMGHPTVLWFFPAANTGGCTVEGCGYRDRYAEFEALGVAIVGVSFTPLETNAAWHERLAFPYEIWRDDERTLATYYNAVEGPDDKYPKRRTRVLNREGKVLLEYNDSIIVGAHPAEVLEDVQLLRAVGRL